MPFLLSLLSAVFRSGTGSAIDKCIQLYRENVLEM